MDQQNLKDELKYSIKGNGEAYATQGVVKQRRPYAKY
jgi:hypothetical protein